MAKYTLWEKREKAWFQIAWPLFRVARWLEHPWARLGAWASYRDLWKLPKGIRGSDLETVFYADTGGAEVRKILDAAPPLLNFPPIQHAGDYEEAFGSVQAVFHSGDRIVTSVSPDPGKDKGKTCVTHYSSDGSIYKLNDMGAEWDTDRFPPAGYLPALRMASFYAIATDQLPDETPQIVVATVYLAGTRDFPPQRNPFEVGRNLLNDLVKDWEQR